MSNNVVPLKKLETSNPYEELKGAYQSEIEEVDSFIKEKLSSHVELIGEMSSYLIQSGGKPANVNFKKILSILPKRGQIF